jgi:hypothetical protein
MNWQPQFCGLAIVSILLAGCGQEGREPTQPSFQTNEWCDMHPIECLGPPPPNTPPPPDYAGNLHDFSALPGLGEPTSPPDPSPGKDGIWLNLAREDCWQTFYRLGSAHTDRDADGFDDNCELRLARAFAPMIRFSNGTERCPGGEAYWVAKFFNNLLPFNTGDFARIGYLMAYYKDCGTLGHIGDSEFIQLTVTFDGATKHWKIINGWYGAHAVIGRPFGNSILGPVGSNSSTWGKEFEWPSGRRYSYPRVWVSENKHANYRSLAACDNGGVFEGAFENCANGVVDNGRFRVWSGNNLGNAHRRLKDCVASLKNAASPVECFWTGTDFGGWQLSGAAATAYLPYLNSIVYGCFFMTAGMQWCSSWGI